MNKRSFLQMVIAMLPFTKVSAEQGEIPTEFLEALDDLQNGRLIPMDDAMEWKLCQGHPTPPGLPPGGVIWHGHCAQCNNLPETATVVWLKDVQL